MLSLACVLALLAIRCEEVFHDALFWWVDGYQAYKGSVGVLFPCACACGPWSPFTIHPPPPKVSSIFDIATAIMPTVGLSGLILGGITLAAGLLSGLSDLARLDHRHGEDPRAPGPPRNTRRAHSSTRSPGDPSAASSAAAAAASPASAASSDPNSSASALRGGSSVVPPPASSRPQGPATFVTSWPPVASPSFAAGSSVVPPSRVIDLDAEETPEVRGRARSPASSRSSSPASSTASESASQPSESGDLSDQSADTASTY